MWNWSTRLFLTEAHQNLTRETEAGLPSKWTKEELDGLEKALREHETWLNIWVEKQKSVKSFEDPVIETTEMKARAKVLETHLQKLAKRRVPKSRKASTTSSSSTSSSTASPNETAVPMTEPEKVEQQIPVDGSEQVPLQQSHPEEVRDEL